MYSTRTLILTLLYLLHRPLSCKIWK